MNFSANFVNLGNSLCLELQAQSRSTASSATPSGAFWLFSQTTSFCPLPDQFRRFLNRFWWQFRNFTKALTFRQLSFVFSQGSLHRKKVLHGKQVTPALFHTSISSGSPSLSPGRRSRDGGLRPSAVVLWRPYRGGPRPISRRAAAGWHAQSW